MKKPSELYTATTRFSDWMMKQPHWRQLFETALHAHHSLLIESAGDQVDTFLQGLTEPMQDMVFGAAVEEMMTRHFDDLEYTNPVDEFDKRRGWRETAPVRRYFSALRDSAMSLYEVEKCQPGQYLVVRDLIRGGAPITVHERSASQQLVQFSRFAGRVLFHLDRHVFSGILFPYDIETAESLRLSISALCQSLVETGQIKTPHIALQRCASLFTGTWLVTVTKNIAQSPTLYNHDGDLMQVNQSRFPLKVSTEEIADALNQCPDLTPHGKSEWAWSTAPLQQTSQLETVLVARFKLSNSHLLMETNSLARRERGKALLQQILATQVNLSAGLSEMLPTPQLNFGRASQEPVSDDTIDAILQFKDRHYRAWPDQALPALDGLSAREAAKRADYRERVILLLKEMTSMELTQAKGDGGQPYDFTWLWQELKLPQ